MEKYRLKEAAKPFFDESLADAVENIIFWDEAGVSMNALEEAETRVMTVERYINIPAIISEIKPLKLASRVSDDGIEFYVTIKFPGTKKDDYAECSAITDNLIKLMKDEAGREYIEVR